MPPRNAPRFTVEKRKTWNALGLDTSHVIQSCVADLPRPPSANRIWCIRGTYIVKTGEYNSWLKEAGLVLRSQVKGRFSDCYALRIQAGRRGDVHYDIGNYEKPISDLLESAGVVKNDKLCQSISVEWVSGVPADQVKIIVIATNKVDS